MAVSRASFGFVAAAALVFTIFLPVAQPQSLAPAPAPTSDGTSIDQGIAYILMGVALALTYLIHSADLASSSSSSF
ncbi:arabinogalactan peptide 22-like [Cucurbita pepo subsp. pepo]|uniref:arabinogalactan peptide 22-like n=1 Tax=Cucurbita pepo subsp. pepo TaxID=3664 RepID=UPI000C9D4323|nr:arabinogalactan peptide 22-like [Cucurbita pepo subsp. pepo]